MRFCWRICSIGQHVYPVIITPFKLCKLKRQMRFHFLLVVDIVATFCYSTFHSACSRSEQVETQGHAYYELSIPRFCLFALLASSPMGLFFMVMWRTWETFNLWMTRELSILAKFCYQVFSLFQTPLNIGWTLVASLCIAAGQNRQSWTDYINQTIRQTVFIYLFPTKISQSILQAKK